MEPIYGTVWIVFDKDNGNENSKRYCWCFETRKLAREHIKFQKRMKHSAKLSQPIKYYESYCLINADINDRKEQK